MLCVLSYTYIQPIMSDCVTRGHQQCLVPISRNLLTFQQQIPDCVCLFEWQLVFHLNQSVVAGFPFYKHYQRVKFIKLNIM